MNQSILSRPFIDLSRPFELQPFLPQLSIVRHYDNGYPYAQKLLLRVFAIHWQKI